jgi:signal transduction histidine kinase
MRSLAVKLTLAFLLVGLIGAVLVAVFLRYRTQKEFNRLIQDQNQQTLVDNLTVYFQANRTWDGVGAVFYGQQWLVPPERAPEPHDPPRRALFLIASPDGEIVYGAGGDVGRTLVSGELHKGVPLEVDGETVGWLIFRPDLDRWEAGSPEGNFLNSVTQATYLSAIAATGIALILGGILAYTLTRSLRELTAATRLLAKGQLGLQVKVRSRDELGTLATSFNQMSAELARSEELRRRATADIAHDIRTPLSVILGYTEALSDGKLPPTQDTFAVMHTEALHLSRLLDDLKTLSLVDAGELPLIYQRIDPGDLLRRAANAIRVQAERLGLEIASEVAPHLPQVEVDVERMAQVLGNVLANALRYTPSGGRITLSAGLANDEVELRIADTGPGIPEEDLPCIFERSYRGDKTRRQQNGEAGLGLAIAKSLVEAQGGRIIVQSRLGEGTTFSIFLPARPDTIHPTL